MDAFSPLPALLGGTLIGLAAAVLWIGTGRIAGVSGIFGRMLFPASDVSWRIAFLAAMVIGAFGAAWVFPSLAGGETPELPGGPLWLAVAGVLTGLGTRIGNGCTSGHGVCGLSRLSIRSLVAVLVFFSVAMLTVAVTGVV